MDLRPDTCTGTHAGNTLTTTWTWDTAPNCIGRVYEVTSPDAIKTYGYNERGQTESVTLGVNGDSFVMHFSYDDFGRVKNIDYPQPLGMVPFGVTHDYDPHGYRIGVRDKATNDPFWELKEVDKAGRIQKEHFGNEVETARSFYDDKQALKSITTTHAGATIQDLSYDWDERLNLKSRKDARQLQNTTERFRSDALNRLTCAYFGLVESANRWRQQLTLRKNATIAGLVNMDIKQRKGLRGLSRRRSGWGLEGEQAQSRLND